MEKKNSNNKTWNQQIQKLKLLLKIIGKIHEALKTAQETGKKTSK